MAAYIQADHLDELTQLAQALYDRALEIAPTYVAVPAETEPMGMQLATRIQAFVLAHHALLMATDMTEPLVVVAMGAASGSTLALCQGNRSKLFEGFQQQFRMALHEVADTIEPKGTA